MSKILITGATGLVGSRFVELSKDKFDFLALVHPNESVEEIEFVSCDLLDSNQLQKSIEEQESDAILHLAAFTDVDGAQKEKGDKKGLCWRLNVEVTRNISRIAQELGTKIIYFSTDFVFDGEEGPYDEEDKTASKENEISWYGWTKLKAEEEVIASGAKYLVARIAYPYRAKYNLKLDFVRNMIQKLEADSLYSMFEDQFLTPTFIDNISRALVILIRENQEGIWHVVDNTILSSYHAAQDVAEVFRFSKDKVKKGSLKGFFKSHPESAPRPRNGGLINDKLNKFLAKHGTSMQTFREALLTMKEQGVDAR